MLRPTLASALVVTVSLAVLGPRSHGFDEPAPCDSIPRAPVLIFDMTATAWGSYNQHVAVYSDGLVISASSERPSSIATVGKAEVQGLREALARAGATGMCDQAQVIMDAPISTVTVFEGGAHARAHTFNFYGGGDYEKVREVVEAFVANAVAGP